ncbi:MAG: MBOAT family O-acyltransferase [Clostridium sp.]|uniref:MBOAT family O-acyltransferase n=1 Tax=Clostridium sp. TaxID=1506 RepID=UPI003F2D7322
MVFSSLVFIFRFLPIFFLTYYIVPKKLKNIVLLIGSLIFYSWGEGKYFLLMVFSILINYFLNIYIEKIKKNKLKIIIFSSGVIFNLGILFIFKYMNFFIEILNETTHLSISEVKITLPLGISFYTFQTLSYCIDVYKKNIVAERNLINFGTFVSMFPQLIAGPIVKYTDINKDLGTRKISKEAIGSGIETFILGLGQKVLIANNVGMLWEEINRMEINSVPTVLAWLGIIAFSLQIYFDFSGYSLMAIGLGEILGFKFPINFRYPYISRSITEFWRRWHITLGSFFREYVYIPLGGSRCGKVKLLRNLFLVWLATGLWHGAEYNFILWGLYFFILILIEKICLENILNKHKIFSHIYTLILLSVGWLIFSTSNLEQGIIYFKNMFIYKGGDWVYYLENYGVILIIGVVLSTPIIKNLYEKFIKNEILKTIILMIIFILSISYIVDSSYNPFLYFRF